MKKATRGIKEKHGDIYDDTELKTRITAMENSIGDIDTILDNINGEVV